MYNYQEIEKILNNLTSKNDVFVVENYPNCPNNRIGIDGNGCTVILVNTVNTSKVQFNESHTENLSIYYNKRCNILIDDKKSCAFYSILLLKDQRLLYYFISLFEIVIQKLGESPELLAFKEEVDNLRMLFNKISIPGLKTILGLWGELFLIETSSDPSCLLASWHKMTTDVTDFNDGFQKIEVKTTTKPIRVHNFSYAQLKKIINPNTLIVSIMTSEIDNGISINDLIQNISERITHYEFATLISKTIDVLGADLKSAIDTKFDYTTALNSIRFFNSVDIPCINEKHISKKIRNIHFEVELDESISIKTDLNFKIHKLLLSNYVRNQSNI